MRKEIVSGFIFLSSLVLLLLVNSCRSEGPRTINPEFARYIAAFTYGTVSSSSSIQIELNQDMPAVELNKEIEDDLFEFSPKIKGKAYWTSSRSIKFVPEPGELKQGEIYDVWFKLDKVLQVEKDFKEFYFYFNVPEQNYSVDLLPYSPTKDNDLTWNTVQGTISFADDAQIADIEKMFKVEGNPNDAKVKVSPTETSGKYLFTIDSLKRTSQDLVYILNVDGSPVGAKKEADKLQINIPGIKQNEFSVVDVRTAYEPTECIRITFSDPLSSNQNIQGLVTPNGVENFSYDIQKNVLKLYLDGSNSASNVNLSIYKELKSAGGKRLDRTYNYDLSVAKNKPDVKLLNAGNILPNSDNLNIPFQAVNLWAVDVSVIKIYENNVLGYLQSNNIGGSEELRRFGRLVAKKRIRLDEDRTLKLGEWNNFYLDLSTLIKQDPGAIYRVLFTFKQEYSLYPCGGMIPQVPQGSELERFDNNSISEDEEAKWDQPYTYYYDESDWSDYDWVERDDPCKKSYYTNRRSDCVVLASNIGMIAKIGSEKKVQVVLTDILTTKPLSGAVVDIYNFQMQRIGSGKTDGDGFVSVPYQGGVPFVIVATNDKEKGYLKVTSNLSLSLSNFDVSGKEIEKGLKGYIYGERGVWRPGDSIYLTFILDDKDNTLPKGHPVSLELFTPTGQLYHKSVNTNGINGFYPFKLATDANAVTGNWRAVIKVGGATFSKTVKIETVKPNRLKIRLNVGEVLDASRGSFSSGLSSQWLHGAPASNLKATVEMSLSYLSNPFKGYESYSFNNPVNKFNSDTYTIFEGRLDASGNASVTAQLPPAVNAPGMLRANFISRVFESGGDASIYTQTVAYSPYPAYIGVKSPAESDYDMLETDKDNMIDIVSLTSDGKPTNRSGINVKVYKVNWSWWWNRNNDDLSSYVNSTSANIVLDQDISTSGGKARVKFRVDYPEWGRYLVLATDKGGHTSGKIIYVDWPSWRGRADKQDASGLTMLSFSTDKRSYGVGEKATVVLPKSSDGRALISIENGSKVLSRNWVKTNATEDTKYTFEVTEEMTPNFYVFATLLQPHAQTDNDLPIRMYGVLNISVDNKNTILTPVITMPDELRPEKEFSVEVSEKNKKSMTYTLAVVDEGLLDLTSFKTPNAWADFYARQALGVRTWDMFDMVVGAQTGKLGPLLSIGGDEALKPSTNPVNRFKPIVKYLGPFTLKKGETQSHKIKLDPYVGSVRVMVVAGNSDGAYGNSEKTVQVKNPLMVLSTLPRVAGPDEEILLPVNVFAMDKKVKNVNISVQASNGLMQFTEGTSKSIAFTEVGDKVVYFKVKVAKKTGAEKITIKATGGGETSNETIDIEVRNPNPAILLTSEALVSAGNSADLNIEMDYPTADDWAKLEVSRMPSVDLSKNMSYLFDYPYGCSEQVTSRAFPLLYVSAFRKFTDKENERMKYVVNEAIKILASRQLGDGGIVYWPGSSYPTEWVTTYAGHFLIEAQNKGYNVPESVISKWKQFQKKAAQRWNRGDLYNSYYKYSMTDLQQAYRLYTLALANQPELGAMNRLKEMSDLSVQARWRLAGAYALAGKKEAANQVIRSANMVVDNYSANNNTYGSPARDMAMIMETNLLLGQTSKALSIAPKVSEELNSYYISTQSAAYGLIAMSKLAEKMGKGIIAFDWSLNGVPQKSQSSGLVYQEFPIKPQEAVNVSFTNTGEGQLYVRLVGRTQPLVDKSAPVNNGLNLYVKYVDENNNEIDVKSLRQGTEFYANVVVQNVSGEAITDVALNQIFPSGWEIFNNRLFNSGANNTSSFNYQDIRDDRVMTFFNLGYGYSTTVKIRLQAAYCGRFYLPAVSTEAMYSTQTQSRTSGMWVEVVQ
ncbi:alpha-2-macroglobulin family protein [Dysgonomonas macrotermitis]|uniref:Alpha-2-macroglobulin family N-terminal region n=1 Tax=Dysgonomonas macrotermitis TaxID=1346286 RepID=A0A1M4T134_9BACT|nr:MG2 domain-containing protein [Dysgonomonas macrotermitis]SHE38159.1 hypothetical protein SAMN05444362_101207 [Dysgonomonas macrotermitis]